MHLHPLKFHGQEQPVTIRDSLLRLASAKSKTSYFSKIYNKQYLGFLIGVKVMAKPIHSVDHFKAGILCQNNPAVIKLNI